ncbi:protein FAM171B [Protopterus annectens]|uniref:protein FAM171B n=1 Tax=Protopterus annectens TaxID=7888 RepID=UPI001CFA820B|nr:protein FAM171B [Protopterus annectens]
MSEVSGVFGQLWLLIFCALSSFWVGVGASGSLNITRMKEQNSYQRHHNQQQQGLVASIVAASKFILKVQVNDVVSRHCLRQAVVEVFVNYTKTTSALTKDDGTVLLEIPYKAGLTLTIMSYKDGYVVATVPWKTGRMPIFSSVTISLFPQSQANIWLYEDTVLISGKLTGAKSQPSVQFIKSLLKPPGNNITNVIAYMTMPQMYTEVDSLLSTMGILINKSGFKSIDLIPLAAVSVNLFSSGSELKVTGPVHITLPLPPSSSVSPADAVPAWTLDRKMGAWVSRGLGMVKKEGNLLVWNYVAPHLGYWIAAPLPGTGSFVGRVMSKDLTAYHTVLLLAILGGTVLIIFGVFSVLFCYCRVCHSQKTEKRLNKFEAIRRDQTTSTSHINRITSLKSTIKKEDKPSFCRSVLSSCSPQRKNSNKEDVEGKMSTAKQGDTFTVCVEDPVFKEGQNDNLRNSSPHTTEYGEGQKLSQQSRHAHNIVSMDRSQQNSEQLKSHEEIFGLPQIPERHLHIYNQPIAILQTADVFHSPEQIVMCKSATLPKKGQMIYAPLTESAVQSSYVQTLPKMPLHAHLMPQTCREPQPHEDQQNMTSQSSSWNRYSSSLLESVSVPGTLNEAAGMTPFSSDLQGISEQTLLELSKVKPSPHPRAWFVSLDGKPAAHVRHSYIDLQKGRKPNSNDTSLDSGVDMNEPHSGKKLEREKTFIKSMPHSKALYSEDLDLSSSESGTTACSPEDPALRHILDGVNEQFIESHQSGEDLSKKSTKEGHVVSASSSPKKTRANKKGEKKVTSQKREERPLVSQN